MALTSKALVRSWKALASKAVVARCSSGHVPELYHEDKTIIGKREIVGYGINGYANYLDAVERPFPAIRWKEEDSTIKALREKEKGDWRKLTLEEKKTLYRFNFRQTLAEVTVLDGEWKSVVGVSLMFIAACLAISIGVRKAFMPELPESMSLERRQAQLLRMLDSNMYPVTGISRDWDVNKRRWKEQ